MDKGQIRKGKNIYEIKRNKERSGMNLPG